MRLLSASDTLGCGVGGYLYLFLFFFLRVLWLIIIVVTSRRIRFILAGHMTSHLGVFILRLLSLKYPLHWIRGHRRVEPRGTILWQFIF